MAKQKWKKGFWLRSSPGLSILLAVILIGVIVVFSIGVTTMVIDTTRQASNVKDGTTAYYAAEAGLEQALWVNHTLGNMPGGAMGANTKGATGGLGGAQSGGGTFKIQGLANDSLVAATVNGVYIQPFPWTGNVPWHGDGAVAVTGGCDSGKPPGMVGEGNGKYFEYKGVNAPYNDAIEHPCNWGKLAVGEKVTVPLFGVGAGGDAVNFKSFVLRLRAPCKDGAEFCAPGDRLELNCFDKGTGEKRCKAIDNLNIQLAKGEVVATWEIDGDNGNNLLPKPSVLNANNKKYLSDDSELFEGKINAGKTSSPLSQVLFASAANDSAQGLVGGDAANSKSIYAFLQDLLVNKPVLKLSVIGSLIGCYGGNSCTSQSDAPESNAYHGPISIPYLEYQVQITDPAATSSLPPASKDNIISAEGQSGAFTQTIQVKVPNDNSSLEYVIQQ